MIDSMDVQSGIAALEGAQLYYETAGSGPWLVLLHAGVADRRMWEGQWEVFAAHFRVLCYDMRGFGRSPMIAGAFSNRQDLFHLLRFLGIESACLVGCSMGGMTAVDFTLEHPQMVRAMVLVSAAVSGYQPAGQPPQEIFDLIAARQAGDFEAAADLQVRIWADGFKRDGQADPHVRALIRRMSLEALENQDEFLRSTGFVMETPLQPPAMERLEQLNMPALVLAGDLDDETVLSLADILVERLPAARKETIQGAAHLPNLEKPQEFNRLVLEFLSSPGLA
jgi:2-hydroxy-6-oxonona-2,4-dienedioate hydrolase